MTQLQEVKGVQAKQDVLDCMTKMIQNNRYAYGHGVTRKELEQAFPRAMRYSLATYGNRMRDLAHRNDGRAGRHTVHGERHYFPRKLHDEGLIDHSKCTMCEEAVEK